MKIDLKDWHKLFNRPVALQQAQLYCISCDKPLAKIIGKGIKNALYVIRNSSADGYFLNNEWREFNDYFLKERFVDARFLKNINGKVLKGSLDIEVFFKNIAKKELKSLNNKELLRIFKDVTKVLNTDTACLWIGFILGEVTEKKVIEVLKRNGVNIDDGLGIISGLEKPHHIIQEQIDLMNIVLSGKNRQRKLLSHYDKYRYIPCYSSIVKPYSLDYFKDRIKSVTKKQAQAYIRKTRDSFKINAKNYKQLIKNRDWSEKDKLFLDYVHQYYFLKDYRSHFRSISMFQHGRVLEEISDRFHLDQKDVSFLLYQEVIELFRDSDKIKNILFNRLKHGQVYVYQNGREFLLKKDNILKNKKINKEISLSGQSASPGITKGLVKIVLNPNEVNKVQEGEILVTTMTRPDYVVAMKKSNAIVTDEGGLLCHAAIIARELKKPCVIGTKIASNVFKDGDLIEVDANNGVVRKLD